MSSFFTTPASQKKRKRPETGATASSKRRTISSTGKSTSKPAAKKSRQVRDESISDNDSDASKGNADVVGDYDEDTEDSSGAEGETADERRLRLAQRYLDNIREEVNDDPYAFDAAAVDRDLIAERLKEDVEGSKGKLHRKIAEQYDFAAAKRTVFTADQNGLSAVAVSLPYAFTASNDGTLVKWELASPQGSHLDQPRPSNVALRTQPKLVKRFRPPRHLKPSYQGHNHQSSILCIAVSASGKYLATGGSDKKLVVWDPATLRPLKSFSQHRDSVLSLSFRRGTHTLYSGGADRHCKVWGLDEMAYVQTLFGHQDAVVDIGGLAGEQFVSIGARDRSARLFKVIEEQQLVYRGGGSGGMSKRDKKVVNGTNGDIQDVDSTRYDEGSIDRIAIIDEETFVTGSDNGSLSLWSVLRKKPVYTVPLAHGADEPLTVEEAYAEEDAATLQEREQPGRRKPRWITALTSIPLADIVLSGSWDGHVRAWRVTPDRKRLESIGALSSPAEVEMADEGRVEAQTNGNKEDLPAPTRGIINDLSLVERTELSKAGISARPTSLCVVAAVSKSHRLGRWHALKGKSLGKNCAVVFEVPKAVVLNGVAEQNSEQQNE